MGHGYYEPFPDGYMWQYKYYAYGTGPYPDRDNPPPAYTGSPYVDPAGNYITGDPNNITPEGFKAVHGMTQDELYALKNAMKEKAKMSQEQARAYRKGQTEMEMLRNIIHGGRPPSMDLPGWVSDYERQLIPDEQLLASQRANVADDRAQYQEALGRLADEAFRKQHGMTQAEMAGLAAQRAAEGSTLSHLASARGGPTAAMRRQAMSQLAGQRLGIAGQTAGAAAAERLARQQQARQQYLGTLAQNRKMDLQAQQLEAQHDARRRALAAKYMQMGLNQQQAIWRAELDLWQTKQQVEQAAANREAAAREASSNRAAQIATGVGTGVLTAAAGVLGRYLLPMFGSGKSKSKKSGDLDGVDPASGPDAGVDDDGGSAWDPSWG